MYCLMNTRNDAFEMSYVETVGEYNCGGYALGLNVWYVPYMSFRLINDVCDNVESEYEYAEDNYDFLNSSENAAMVDTARANYDYVYSRLEQTEEEFEELLTEYLGRDYEEDDLAVYEHWNGNDVADFAAWVMLKVFPWLRKIEDWEELDEDEYGIVFAVGGYDFHFARRDVYDGEVYWTHKMGGDDVEDIEGPDEAFGDRYDSKRIMFAAIKEDYR